MRWLLFVLELFLLFVTFNALFMLPGAVNWFTFVAPCVGISLSAVCAWFSAKKFLGFQPKRQMKLSDAAGTLPGGLWIPVVLIYVGRLTQLALTRTPR